MIRRSICLCNLSISSIWPLVIGNTIIPNRIVGPTHASKYFNLSCKDTWWQICVCGTIPTLLVDDYELLSLLDLTLNCKEVVPDICENLYPSSPWQSRLQFQWNLHYSHRHLDYTSDFFVFLTFNVNPILCNSSINFSVMDTNSSIDFVKNNISSAYYILVNRGTPSAMYISFLYQEIFAIRRRQRPRRNSIELHWERLLAWLLVVLEILSFQ